MSDEMKTKLKNALKHGNTQAIKVNEDGSYSIIEYLDDKNYHEVDRLSDNGFELFEAMCQAVGLRVVEYEEESVTPKKRGKNASKVKEVL